MVTLTDDDNDQIALDITTRHASDVHRQAIYDAVNVTGKGLVNAINTYLSGAFANVNDAIVGLFGNVAAAAAAAQTTSEGYTDTKITDFIADVNAISGIGSVSTTLAQAIQALADFSTGQANASSVALQAAIKAQIESLTGDSYASFAAAINGLGGYSLFKLTDSTQSDTSIPDDSAIGVKVQNGVGAAAIADARINNAYLTEVVALQVFAQGIKDDFNTNPDLTITMGSGGDSGKVVRLEFLGGIDISTSTADIKTAYEANNENSIMVALQSLRTTLQAGVLPVENGIGVTQLF